MRDFVRASVRDPRMRIRNKVIEITAGVPSKDFGAEISTIYEWVRENIRFIKDPVGVETVASPVRTLDLGAGDCDDQAVLLASLLINAGHPVRFVAVGFQPGIFSHVFTETRIGGHWVPLETTVPMAYIGWKPPNIRALMTQTI